VILADTSVWIDHFRTRSPAMHQLLLAEEIVMHPCVIIELSLGSLQNRSRTIPELGKLDSVKVASTAEVHRMIEAHALYSRGIGLVDAHLLASCLLTPAVRLWTRDARLAGVARLLNC